MSENNNLTDEPNLEDLASAAEQEARAAADQPTDDPRNGATAKLRAERDELRDRLARVQADFVNSRKRLEADFDLRMQYANSALIKALLPVIDNFERALAVDPATTDTATVLKGLQVVHDQMMDVLSKQNVNVISPAAGEPFDPGQHEAVMQQASDQVPDHCVLQVLQRGYRLYDRTLRPASVIVSKGN